MHLYSYIRETLCKTLGEDVILERPKNKDFGHYATPLAFSLAKTLKKPPKDIANDICEKLQNLDIFSKVENLNGYINLTLSVDVFNRFINSALQEGLYGGLSFDTNIAESESKTIESKATDSRIQSQANPKSQKILLEYVSANPTGPLHIGHARGAVLGDSLKRIGQYLGFEIITEYYINDAGAQILMLGRSILLAGQEHILKQKVIYPEQYYKGEYIIEIANLAKEKFGAQIFSEENVATLAEFGKELMLEEIKQNLASIGISFDNFISERALFSQWQATLEQLKKSSKIYQKEGKTWLQSSIYGDEKDRVIVREDGEPTYLAGDIIYHCDKFKRNFDSYINIWGADHHGYIARVKAAIKILGFDESKLNVLLAQMVSLLQDGAPYKMSKRAGNFILMRDVVADIGADALRFVFLSKKPDTHLEFDISDLSKQDSSNPIFYINYANARIHTLLSKSTLSDSEILQAQFSDSSEDKEALDLVFLSLQLPRIAQMAWEEKSLQKICEYLKSLASEFHTFYNATPILKSPKQAEYLKICKMISQSITLGLLLLGIKAKTKM